VPPGLSKVIRPVHAANEPATGEPAGNQDVEDGGLPARGHTRTEIRHRKALDPGLLHGPGGSPVVAAHDAGAGGGEEPAGVGGAGGVGVEPGDASPLLGPSLDALPGVSVVAASEEAAPCLGLKDGEGDPDGVGPVGVDSDGADLVGVFAPVFAEEVFPGHSAVGAPLETTASSHEDDLVVSGTKDGGVADVPDGAPVDHSPVLTTILAAVETAHVAGGEDQVRILG
jgi:hypothetical protein